MFCPSERRQKYAKICKNRLHIDTVQTNYPKLSTVTYAVPAETRINATHVSTKIVETAGIAAASNPRTISKTPIQRELLDFKLDTELFGVTFVVIMLACFYSSC